MSEISTLHPVANADALEVVVRLQGGNPGGGAALLKTGTDTPIYVFYLGGCWCANIPSIHRQKG